MPPADPLKVFNLAQLGVQLVASPLHQQAAAEVIRAQNAVYDKDERGGGLRKRPGMAKLNAVALAGGAVNGSMFVAFADPGNPLSIGVRRGLYLLEHTGGDLLYTSDVVNWASVVLPQSTPFPIADAYNHLPFNTDDRMAPVGASLPGRLYFLGATGTFSEVWRWDGVAAARVVRPPAPPQTGAGSAADVTLTAIYAFDGALYLCSMDGNPALTGGNALFGRVFKLDPDTETLTQIGTSTWGSHSGGLLGGAPGALEWFAGRLWAAGATYQSGVAPRVYSIRPGIDEDWTLEETGTAGHSFTGLKVYRGELYATTRGASGTASFIRKRTTAGVWSTVRTNPSSVVGNSFSGLAVVNGLLTVAERDSYSGAGDDEVSLFSYNGTAFTERVDFRTDYFGALGAPGIALGGVLEYDDAVYYLATAIGVGGGSLVLRTVNGTTYTEVYDQLGVGGAPDWRNLLGVLRD